MKRKCLWAFVVGLACGSAWGWIPEDSRILMRGDANSDAVVDMADALTITSYLYIGSAEPPCLNQADANNDGVVDGSDAIYLLQWLFNGGFSPPAPGPRNDVCVADDDPYPGCAEAPCG